MNRQSRISGLYAITPDERDTAELLRKVRLALKGGARVLQYRNKIADASMRREQAKRLRALTREHDAVFIVNDDAALAREAEADGVHLGGTDGSVAAARALLGSGGLIGVSCYNRLELARAAARQGADYVAFGAFFPSGVKPEAVNTDMSLLDAAQREFDLPVVAIGGITPQNGASLVAVGADALAVISALWNAPDIEGAAREFSNLFRQGSPA